MLTSAESSFAKLTNSIEANIMNLETKNYKLRKKISSPLYDEFPLNFAPLQELKKLHPEAYTTSSFTQDLDTRLNSIFDHYANPESSSKKPPQSLHFSYLFSSAKKFIR